MFPVEDGAAVDDDDIAAAAVVVTPGTENDAAGVITMARQKKMKNNTGCIHDINSVTVNLMVVKQVESVVRVGAY